MSKNRVESRYVGEVNSREADARFVSKENNCYGGKEGGVPFRTPSLHHQSTTEHFSAS